MPLVIADDVVRATHFSESEFKTELAVFLFQKNKLTLGQASKLAEMGQFEFQHLLASRKIPVHYDLQDYKDDMKTLKDMGLL